MQVEKAHPGAISHRDGHTVYFCSDHCRARYDANPQRYTSAHAETGGERAVAARVDPVCGMTVEPDTAAARSHHDGRDYHFCSTGCANTFADNPTRFAGATGPTIEDMRVTLLYFEGCPNWHTAESRIRQALRDLDVEQDALTLQQVEATDDLEMLAFRGSPTVLVNGSDPFADPAAPVGFSCRVYRTETGLANAPTLDQLTAALAAAR